MPLNYSVIAQSAEQVRDGQNSPATSMWPYLLETAQTSLLNKISVYSGQGTTREQVRFLYMNATAVDLWRAMGNDVTIVSETHRPPRSALLTFGMPFGE